SAGPQAQADRERRGKSPVQRRSSCHVADLSSAARDLRLDRLDRLRDDQVDTECAERRARPAWIASISLTRLQPVGADQAWIERHHQRGIGQSRMAADLAGRIALAFEQPAKAVLALLVILEYRVRAHRRRRPFPVETLGDSG